MSNVGDDGTSGYGLVDATLLLGGSRRATFDAANAFVLPGGAKRRRASQHRDGDAADDDMNDGDEDAEARQQQRKRMKLKKLKQQLQSDLLSKRKKKELERVVRKKESAKTRSALWEELRQYQFPTEAGSAADGASGGAAGVQLLPSTVIHGVASKRAKARATARSTADVGGGLGEVASGAPPTARPPMRPLLKGWQAQAAAAKATEDGASTDTSDLTVTESEDEDKEDEEEVVEGGDADKTEKVEQQEKEDEVKAEVASPALAPSRPATFVPVRRSKAVERRRRELPILSEEHSVMDALSRHDVVVICGQTGSGKTTQVPQFLYEAGYASDGRQIVVTEPRRVAAVAMSERVADELGLGPGRVAYQIRYQGNVTDATVVKFVTDGVLLKELETDVLLRRYSAVVIDEAHERTVYTDILVGLLSRVVLRRRRLGHPLKLLVMSATLRVQDFVDNPRLFPAEPKPPLVRIDARQYPVTVHFSRRTEDDYLKAAYAKVCRLHASLPAGGVLVFVTGAQEVVTLASWLRRAFKKARAPASTTTASEAAESDQAADAAEDRRLEVCLDNYAAVPRDEDAELDEAPVDAAFQRDGRLQTDEADADADAEGFGLPDEAGGGLPPDQLLRAGGPVHVVGLYSLLPPERQALAFCEPPAGHRMIVVATNVAETSITIPCVRYVVDTGRVKAKVYDRITGVSTFVVSWTSKASAEQRAGRAGRLGPGHCYRLYSSQVYTDSFKEFSEPELLTKPVDEVVLLAKQYVNDVLHFPFPNAPNPDAVAASEARLVRLGALDSRKRLTQQGALMRQFPVAARFAKMLVVCEQQEHLIPYVILLVACLSVPEVFVEESTVTEEAAATSAQQQEGDVVERRRRGRAFKRSFARAGQALLLGDASCLLGLAAWYERQLQVASKQQRSGGGGGKSEAELAARLAELGVRHRAVCEVRKLRRHLTDIAGRLFPRRQVFLDPALPPPPDRVSLQMRRLLVAVMPDQVARRVPEKPRAYRAPGLVGELYIHPSSVLARELPPAVLYQEVHESSRMFMRCVSAVDEAWLLPSPSTTTQPAAVAAAASVA